MSKASISNKRKSVPAFRSEAEERRFWETHGLDRLCRLEQGRACTFPNLKPSTTSISLRLPVGLLDRIKDRCEQARHALSVADQGVAGGKSE